MVVRGPDFDTGEMQSTTILVPLGRPADAAQRLNDAGLTVTLEEGRAKIEEPFPGTPFFEEIGKSFDYYADDPVEIATIKQAADRMAKEIFYVPAVILLAVVVLSQLRRRKAEGTASPAQA